MTDREKILSFHAPWCSPCEPQGEIIDEIEEETDVVVEHYDIDTDDGLEVANEYAVRSVPTTIVLDGGVVSDQFVGLTEKETILEAL